MQLITFRDNIAGYATTLGLTPAETASQAADAAYYEYIVASSITMRQADQQWSAWHNWERFGGTGSGAGFPVVPDLGTAPAVVPPGIEGRFRALAQKIKDHPNSNPAIEEALGIRGTESEPLDTSTVQPRLKVKLLGGTVFVDWGWGGHSKELDMIRLEVDRSGTGNFTLLAMDTTPGYSDSTPFPASAAKWTYRAIYYVDDGAVGLWSDPVSVTVGQ